MATNLQSGSDPIVLAQEDGVHGGKGRLLRRPVVATLEAEPGLGLALVVFVRLGQQVLAARGVWLRRVQPTVDALAKVGCVAPVIAVDLRRVDERRVLVQLLPGA